MKPKRKIIALTSLIVIASFLFVGAVNAAPRGGGPFEQLWDAIFGIEYDVEELQTQIDEIELTPGPQGPPGLGFSQTGTISIPAAQFTAEMPSIDSTNVGNVLSHVGPSSRAKFYAGVQLPDGATLTDVSVQWYDSGPDRNDLVLMRNQLDGGAHYICLISSDGSSGLSFDSEPVITDFAIVDNSQNSYYVLVDLPASATPIDYSLYQIFIEYEYTT